MEASHPKLVLCLLVDALRPDYVERTRYLRQLAAGGATGLLREGFGFVPRAAYFGGLDAERYGFTNMYCHDPTASPFSLARALSGVSAGARIERALGLRQLIESAARERLPAFARAYASSIDIPLRFLGAFDVVEKYAPWDRSISYRSLFHLLEDHGHPWYECAWPRTTGFPDPSDDGIVRQALSDLHPEHRFAFVHLQELDAVGHLHGPQSSALQAALDRTDRRCERLVETLRARFGQLEVVLFGDHGMVNVIRTLDIAEVLDRTGLRFGADYSYFLDSTMARFWFHHASARRTIEAALTNLTGGRLLHRNDLQQYGIAQCDPRNGELIYLADPGVLIFPNFFQSEGDPIKGMHGYAPDCPDNLGFFLVHRSPHHTWAGQWLGLVDPPMLFPTLCALLDIHPDGPPLTSAQVRPAPPGRSGLFTCHPDPAADAAVETHLGEILDAIHKSVGQPEAVVLTGSFGRGEGGVFQDESGRFEAVNDYDLLVVDRRDLREALRPLARTLPGQLGIDFVDLGWSDGQWSQWPTTVFNYDLKYGSRVVEGDAGILDRLPAYAAADIPAYEAVKLLLNRSAGILSGLREHLFTSSSPAQSKERYLTHQIVKAWMALGDTHLIRWGGYDSSYRRRQQRLRWLGPGANLPPSVLEKIYAAYGFKCLPQNNLFPASREEVELVAPQLSAALVGTIGWLTETEVSDIPQATAEYLTVMSRDSSWVLADNAACLAHPEMGSLLRPQTADGPSLRHRIYAVIPLLLEAVADAAQRESLLHETRQRLNPVFVLPAGCDQGWSGWEQLRSLVVRAWFAWCH